MEDLIAAAIFITALSALVVFAVLALKPFLPGRIVEVPTAPSQDVPTRRIYVYNDSGMLYAVEHQGDVEAFRKAVGVPGVLVAVFEVYPGGYRCWQYTETPVRIGGDPYTGLWCPPPFEHKAVDKSCVPVGLTSRGRWLLVQYRCPGTP